MAIPLTGPQTTEIGLKVRKPRHLVEIILGLSTLRLCTGSDITWNGNVYSKAGLRVSSVSTAAGGLQTCQINIINEDQVYSVLAITAGFLFRSVKFWKVYGDTPAIGDPILQFQGEIVAVPRMSEIVSFECATKYGTTRRVPNLTIGPPHVKHLPFPGQKFTIGNEVFTVDSR